MQKGHKIITRSDRSYRGETWEHRFLELEMYLVPPFTSQIQKWRPITFFSECTTNTKTTIQHINKRNFLTFRIVKKGGKPKFAMPENDTFIIRMTDEGQLIICHWFLCWEGGRDDQCFLSSLSINENSTIMKVLPVAQGIWLFYVVWKQVEASVSLFHLVDSHHHWQQWGWIRYLPVCRKRRKYVFNQETEMTYQV